MLSLAVVIALIISLHGAVAENPFQTFTPDSYGCQAQGIDRPDGNAIYSLDYTCDSLQVPSAWQKKSTEKGVDYDLIIIGGGIGGAYLVNRLAEEFAAKNQTLPSIALFERAPTIGGRLMSAFGDGALGLAVNPFTPEMKFYTLQEYGGMRIDPYAHPLIFNKVLQVGRFLFGPQMCNSTMGCRGGGDFCCPGMLTRMEVGGIRYATARKNFGVLSESSVLTPSQSYFVDPNGYVRSTYSLENIAEGIGSPYDKCLQLLVAAVAYYGENSTMRFPDAMNNMCQKCNASKIVGLCTLCSQFPDPASAVGSCTGYDFNVQNMPLSEVNGFADEVVNVNRGTNLYLFTAGYQRFVQSLLRWNGVLTVAPQLQKTFTGLSLAKSGDNLESLAQAQVDSLSGAPMNDTVPTRDNVTAYFADGSSATATAIYISSLPFDMAAISGFTPWETVLGNSVNNADSAKIILGWKDANEALANLLNMTPCVPGPCERLILDGPADDGWMVRQVWLWDELTIMIYDDGTIVNASLPATTIINTAKNEGMDVLITRVMDQIRQATNLTIKDPDWARLKSWPAGSLIAWNSYAIQSINSTPAIFSSRISRPLGYNVPVYYGNSEAAPDNADHAWAEGALVMVEDSLQSLATYLGLKGKVTSPSREKLTVADGLKDLQNQVDANPSRAPLSTPVPTSTVNVPNSEAGSSATKVKKGKEDTRREKKDAAKIKSNRTKSQGKNVPVHRGAR